MSKIVVITGASSGLGKVVAEKLQKEGHTVIGSSRYPEKYPLSTVALQKLEVQNPQDIDSFTDQILQKHQRIDVLINNAGIGIAGAVEEIPAAEMQKVFSTNYFGPMLLMQKILPIMRAQNGGIIINIASIAACMGLPFRAHYCASKAALAIGSEALQYEVKKFGIKIVTLFPGDIQTDIISRRYHSPKQQDSPYLENYTKTLALMNKGVEEAENPQAIAKLVLKIIEQKAAKHTYKVGNFLQRFSVVLKRILPYAFFEKLILHHYKLK